MKSTQSVLPLLGVWKGGGTCCRKPPPYNTNGRWSLWHPLLTVSHNYSFSSRDWVGSVIQPQWQISSHRRESNLGFPTCKTCALTTASWEHTEKITQATVFVLKSDELWDIALTWRERATRCSSTSRRNMFHDRWCQSCHLCLGT